MRENAFICPSTVSRIGPPHVVIVDIDALGACRGELGVEVSCFVIDARIEPEFVGNVIALGAPAGDAHRPAAFQFRELADDAADRTARR